MRPATFTLLARSQLNERRLDAARRTVHLALAELRRRKSRSTGAQSKTQAAAAEPDIVTTEGASAEAATYDSEADGFDNSSLTQLVCLAVEVCVDGGTAVLGRRAVAESVANDDGESSDGSEAGEAGEAGEDEDGDEGSDSGCAFGRRPRISRTQAIENAIELLTNVGASRRLVATAALEARGVALEQLPPPVKDALGR